MSDTMASLRRQIDSAGDLKSVVRTMKALAAANIGQYEKSVCALADYYRTVELGLSACLREREVKGSVKGESGELPESAPEQNHTSAIHAIVFGSDQGLVGQFNDVIADFAIAALTALPGKANVWAVGERVQARLHDAGFTPAGHFAVPNSVKAIAPLVGQILIDSESQRDADYASSPNASLYVFHNAPLVGAQYEPVSRRLLPLDAQWQMDLIKVRWPTKNMPEVMQCGLPTLQSLIHEYLFISLFRGCAESLASENASRLAAMQRAEKNIEELLENLQRNFHQLRQSSIDEELFDVISGYNTLGEKTIDSNMQ